MLFRSSSGVGIFNGGKASVAEADFEVRRFAVSGTFGLRATGCVVGGPPERPPATACEANSCLRGGGATRNTIQQAATTSKACAPRESDRLPQERFDGRRTVNGSDGAIPRF